MKVSTIVGRKSIYSSKPSHQPLARRLLALLVHLTYQFSMSYHSSMSYQFGMTYQAGMTYQFGRLLCVRIHTYMHMYDIIFSVMFHVKHLYSTL